MALLSFFLSGLGSALGWSPTSNSYEWHIPLLFGIAMTLLCRARVTALTVAWIPVSCAIWAIVYFSASWIALMLKYITDETRWAFAVIGTLGAVLFAGAFGVLTRHPSWRQVGWLAIAGFVGGGIFVIGADSFGTGVGAFQFMNIAPGLCCWQVAIGSRLVWLSVPDGNLRFSRK
jgi:hypothetical protein